MKYKHIVFDTDTLSDMENAASESLKETLCDLQSTGYTLGLIGSGNKGEYQGNFIPFGLEDYFGVVIWIEDNTRSKSAPNPMLEYMEATKTRNDDILYVGDSIYDMQCAVGAKVDFGLALWGNHPAKHIYSTYYFHNPKDIPYTLDLNTDPYKEIPWLKWAMELQFISQAGVTYSKDAFDLERFERISEIAAEIMSLKSGMSPDYVKTVFCNETGFQTPKLDTRAAIFQDEKILLVKENNGTWSLPGGWVDVNESIKSNTIKEVKEEAGLDVIPVKLIAVQDRNKHNLPIYAYGISKAFVLCDIIGGDFNPNIETQKSGFFGLDELPRLALEKNNEKQIAMCFDAYKTENWDTIFD